MLVSMLIDGSTMTKTMQPILALIFALFLLALTSLANNSGYSDYLPPGAKRIAPNRYVSAKSYEDTKKFYAQKFVAHNLLRAPYAELNLPQVRSWQLVGDNPQWAGINIYFKAAEGLTEIFLIPPSKAGSAHEKAP
jgi:hypothetical protein